MSNNLKDASVAFLEKHVLPCFNLPDGSISWQGESELDRERSVFYFHCNDANYLLVRELYHGAGDHTLASLLPGNAVFPHQKIVIMHPKEDSRTYIHVSKDELSHNQPYAGDYSLFRID